MSADELFVCDWPNPCHMTSVIKKPEVYS